MLSSNHLACVVVQKISIRKGIFSPACIEKKKRALTSKDQPVQCGTEQLKANSKKESLMLEE
jgi:hypothetical protein